MVKEIQYTSINRVLDNLHDDELMQNLTLEQVVRHTVRFIGKNGMPKMFKDKMEDVEIHDFRGLLPCDLVSIIQVKDVDSGICLRSMTDNFPMGMQGETLHHKPCVDPMNNINPPHHPHHPHPMHTPYIPPLKEHLEELSFKTQGRVIYTSFPEGKVTIAYKSIPVDENGYPQVIDNEVYLAALEAYITMKVLQQKFRKGEISAQVYQDAQQDYAWEAGQLNSEFMIPSVSEMESIARMWGTMIPKMREFDNGFRDLGNREYLRKQ